MPSRTIPASHHVAILVLPSVVLFDLAVPLQIFGYPRPDAGAMRYRVSLCGPRPGPVVTAMGFPVVVPHGLAPLARAATIVVVGVDDTEQQVPASVCRALRQAHARGARLVSICTGAFVLAAAGLLDGRRATTHWLDVPQLRARYPAIDVDANVLYVDEGSILTSAGLAAGIDLCLHIVRSDHGAAVANTVARRLVVPAHRAGGQAQFIPRAVPQQSGSLEAVRVWARAHLDAVVTVPVLAARAHLSTRQFIRRFRGETGLPPLQWLLLERVREAQALLENTDLAVEQVARRSGFGSAMSMRGHFHRHIGVSPASYRLAFRRRSLD